MVIDFDLIYSRPSNRKLLHINRSMWRASDPDSRYQCYALNKTAFGFIFHGIKLNIATNPRTSTSEELERIKEHVQRDDPDASQSPTTEMVKTAINAYISLIQVYRITNSSSDCRSFVTTLKSVYPSPLKSAGNMITRFFRKVVQKLIK
jgi:hypothetical protein